MIGASSRENLFPGVSDQVRHKPRCTAKEDGYVLECLDLGSRGIVLSIYVAKTMALISCAVTCAFVFAYAKSRFSHDAGQNDFKR